MFQPDKKVLNLGTRGSKLAMFQARLVESLIKKKFPQIKVKIVVLKTSGDRFSEIKSKRVRVGSHEFAGKGLFVKEIEEALLRGDIDFAVHSLKDVPIELLSGLTLAAFTKRAPSADLFVSFKAKSFAKLGRGAVVGTSSPRRAAQLKRKRPDLVIRPIRGNVETRLEKLRANEFDAAIFAEAGLKRLGLLNMPAFHFERLGWMLPAMGQGIICCETRTGDFFTNEIIRKSVNCSGSSLCAIAERAFLREIGGDCHTPIAALAATSGDKISLKGAAFSDDGAGIIEGEGFGSDAEFTGRALGRIFVDAGARKVIGLPVNKKGVLLSTHTALSRSLYEKFRKRGLEIVRLPVLCVEPPSDNFRELDRVLKNIKKVSWLIFTSRHAVESFVSRGGHLKIRKKDLPQIAAVGKSTADLLSELGVQVGMFPKRDFSAESLLRLFERSKISLEKAVVLSAEGAQRTIPAEYVAAYKTSPAKIPHDYLRRLFATEKIKVICHGSSKGAAAFAKLVAKADVKIPAKKEMIFFAGKF